MRIKTLPTILLLMFFTVISTASDKPGIIALKNPVDFANILIKNNVFVGHIGGGVFYSPEGVKKSILTAEITIEGENYTGPSNLMEVRISDGRLINLLVFGQMISIYKFVEE